MLCDLMKLCDVMGSRRGTYDSMQSAGYRNFAVSLLLVNEDTMRLGVDGHVCELQLGVKAIEQHRSTSGHANYTKWRDARAE